MSLTGDWFARPPALSPTTRNTGRAVTWLTLAVVAVAGFEGYASKPYIDTIGTGHPITCGYGETGVECKNPPKTEQEAKAALAKLLTSKYDPAIRKCIHVPMPPHREAALVSAAYNLGPSAICTGQIARRLNAGDVAGGCRALLGYDHANGKVVKGLTTRRQAEYALCIRND